MPPPSAQRPHQYGSHAPGLVGESEYVKMGGRRRFHQRLVEPCHLRYLDGGFAGDDPCDVILSLGPDDDRDAVSEGAPPSRDPCELPGEMQPKELEQRLVGPVPDAAPRDRIAVLWRPPVPIRRPSSSSVHPSPPRHQMTTNPNMPGFTALPSGREHRSWRALLRRGASGLSHPRWLSEEKLRHAVWAVVLVACSPASSSSVGAPCKPGAVSGCVCSGGTKGAQVCQMNGSSFGACTCDGGVVSVATDPRAGSVDDGG